MISEKERAQIEKQTHELLEKFGKALKDIKIEESKHKNVTEKTTRKEKQGSAIDPDFKKRMFANAPKHDDEYIIAEKANW